MTPDKAMKPTAEDAIKRLKSMIFQSDMSPSTLRAIAINNMAINALEKKIPEKPVKESLSDYLCPECQSYLIFDALNENVSSAPAYCYRCGQKIDWSELK